MKLGHTPLIYTDYDYKTRFKWGFIGFIILCVLVLIALYLVNRSKRNNEPLKQEAASRIELAIA